MTDSTELSEREQEILRLVATGASNKEIAQRLTISANTVKVHLRNIFAKIGAVSRTEAAMYAVKTGMVPGATPAGEEINPLVPPRDSSAPVVLTRRSPWLPLVLGAVFLAAIFLGTLRMVTRNNQTATAPPPTEESLWQVYSDLPTPRSGLAAAVYEGMIYAIGGEDQQGVSSLVQRYDPAGRRWQDLAPKPTPVSDVQAAVLGGRIFLPGGRSASGEVIDALEIYDPRVDAWEKGASLPSAASGYALAAFEGKLYLFGGWDGKESLNTVYRYDPALDAWEALPPMPTPRSFAGAAVAGREIYVFGGTDGDRVFRVNEVFSPDLRDNPSQAWRSSTPLPDARYAMGASSVADTVYIIGGTGESIQFPSLAFFPQEGEWQSFEDPPLEVGSHLSLVSLGTSLFVLGGEVADAPVGTNLAYKAMYTISIPLITK